MREHEEAFTPLHPFIPAFQSGDEGKTKIKSSRKPRLLRRGVTGFTLLELLIVMVIIGVMASIAVNYRPVIERSLNKEAEVNLKLIAAGERIYRIENGVYYYAGNATALNTQLRLDLPQGNNANWDYKVVDPGGSTGFNATATRSAYDTRVFHMNETATEPVCMNGRFCF